MGIFAPIVGFLADYFGPRKVLFGGVITTGAGLILLGQTQSLTMFYCSFVLLAFGAGGCTSVVTMTAVANWFRKKAGIALGLVGSGIGAGGLMVLLIVRLRENSRHYHGVGIYWRHYRPNPGGRVF